jgi:hypothetical protein
MREHIYKAKQHGSKRWIEGWFGGIINGGSGDTALIVQSREDGALVKFFAHPKTVCQYIGRRDANGERIFEGDEIEYSRIEYWSQSSHPGYIDIAGHSVVTRKCFIEYRDLFAGFCLSTDDDFSTISFIFEDAGDEFVSYSDDEDFDEQQEEKKGNIIVDGDVKIVGVVTLTGRNIHDSEASE